MPIPFPGMKPYLEHPDLWPTVHQRFMSALADTLKQTLPPIYQVRLCERHYQVSGEDSLVVGSPGFSWNPVVSAELPAAEALSADHSLRLKSPLAEAAGGQNFGIDRADDHAGDHAGSLENVSVTPRVEASADTIPIASPSREPMPIPVLVPVPQKIYETYLEVIDTTGSVVTVIEALSPKKKRPGRGRDLYERQREAIFGSDTHFVEIDLLRGWEPPSMYGPDESGDYRILVSRSEQRPRAQLYTWNVLDPIPVIALPLNGPTDLTLPLKPVVDQACDRTDLLVNYQQSPLPPLRWKETVWLEDFLQKVGMRPCVS
ncbi:MAG: DUF4058 family protein [Cyanobacteria bacterium J06643_4]